MYEPLRRRMLTALKVPPEPHPPLGDPASLRVFRAGRNYYRLRMFGWGLAQAFALLGIVFWTTMLIEVERIARAEASRPPAAPAVAPATDQSTAALSTKPAQPRQRNQKIEGFVKRLETISREPNNSRPPLVHWWSRMRQYCVEVALLMPPGIFPVVWVLKIIGIAAYLVQLAVSYAARRLDYEMRWYMVTDRSLRLRHGVWVVWESTMSFANIQQVVVSQGPLQRLLGLADVKVQSAGGGTRYGEKSSEDMHVGYFHSVTNAEEIRDLILRRLRRFRESGLGDPDEKRVPSGVEGSALTPVEGPALSTVEGPARSSVEGVLAAAREFAAEARALRAAIEKN